MERDKFLTEAMGYFDHLHNQFMEMSSWQQFGVLWTWAQKQDWWRKFGDSVYEDTYDSDPKYKMPICELEYFINPDRFSEAVYEFLNSEEGKRR